ncbi:nuclear transport factor 2 family protein [Elongatibacter sediminis]|uniref:Nuclear transport factor 2 family protein n=1 Tax=Elongatibacter sediminis TaxID=3119006 RepID=A0AAW9RJQ9_9GAMM
MISDLDRIRRLADDYCWFADNHDAEGIVSLFTPDGVMDATAMGMGVIQGEQELRRFYREIIPLHEYSQHISGTHRIDLDGDQAAGTAYYLMHGAVKDAGPISAAGYFQDDYVRTSAGWRIRSRRGVPLAPPNLSAIIEQMDATGTSAG